MAIVTPIWRLVLKDDEAAFVRITERTNPTVDRWFAAPDDLDLTYYREHFPTWRVRHFPPHAFESVRSYSLWLTAPGFYESFAEYEFVTICQTDAVLVKSLDDLEMVDVDGSPLDYLGAPWDPPVKVLAAGGRVYVASDFDKREGLAVTRLFGRTLDVGNGGLTTRRTVAMIDLTRHLSAHYSEVVRQHTLEDVLICAVGRKRGLRIASRERAEQVYQETQVQGATVLPDIFGFHALSRWNPALILQLTSGQRHNNDNEAGQHGE